MPKSKLPKRNGPRPVADLIPPVRPSEAARTVHQRMKESQAAYGHLTPKHIAAMLEFTKFLFKCPQAAILIPEDSTAIKLSPIVSPVGSPDVSMTPEQWDAAVQTFQVRKHEPDLPKLFSLTVHSIEFVREIAQ